MRVQREIRSIIEEEFLIYKLAGEFRIEFFIYNHVYIENKYLFSFANSEGGKIHIEFNRSIDKDVFVESIEEFREKIREIRDRYISGECCS